MGTKAFWGLLLVALALGLAIAFVDTGPGWDDTGITALALAGTCFVLGWLGPSHPWLWAGAITLGLPVLTVVRLHQWPNYGSLLALAFALAGAYAGAFVRRSWAAVRRPA